ncbi:MAG: hypothetical protein SVV67_08700 [Bacillota bacterium]|nr:hypothetical protein [Bacillota bacterium]
MPNGLINDGIRQPPQMPNGLINDGGPIGMMQVPDSRQPGTPGYAPPQNGIASPGNSILNQLAALMQLKSQPGQNNFAPVNQGAEQAQFRMPSIIDKLNKMQEIGYFSL